MKHRVTYSLLIAIACASGLFANPVATSNLGRIVPVELDRDDWPKRFATLRAHAADAPDAVARADRLVSGALWLVGRPLAPSASRWLLGRVTDADSKRAALLLPQAQELLEEAAEACALAKDWADADPAALWQTKMDLDAARALTRALSVLWRVEAREGSDRDAALSDAAGELVIVLEDDRPDVVAAAQLWLAHLYLERGLRQRALDTLPRALEAPVAKGRHAFYARWLRCNHFMPDATWLPGAISLAARFEEQCRGWFDNQTTDEQAQRTASLLRRTMLERWGKQFRDAGRSEASAWCDRSIAELDELFFADGDVLLPLEFAVPRLRDISAIEALMKPAENAPEGARSTTQQVDDSD